MASIKKETDLKNTLQQVVEQEKAKAPSKYQVNKVLFTWEANDRPTYQFNGTQKTSFVGLMLLMGLYFFWIGQPLLTLVTAAVFFIMFVFVSIPAQRVKHSIETVGIRTLDYLYPWDDMRGFWFSEKDGGIMLYIDTRLTFPSRLIFIVESFQEAAQIVAFLVEKMQYKFLRNNQPWLEQMTEGVYVDPSVFFGDTVINQALAQSEQKADDQDNV